MEDASVAYGGCGDIRNVARLMSHATGIAQAEASSLARRLSGLASLVAHNETTQIVAHIGNEQSFSDSVDPRVRDAIRISIARVHHSSPYLANNSVIRCCSPVASLIGRTARRFPGGSRIGRCRPPMCSPLAMSIARPLTRSPPLATVTEPDLLGSFRSGGVIYLVAAPLERNSAAHHARIFLVRCEQGLFTQFDPFGATQIIGGTGNIQFFSACGLQSISSPLDMFKWKPISGDPTP
ncbi:hypothetical protein DFH06DRAFT_1346843 [Mycena polygramma]|nr:hypothetical protein DFH06DRAFT_1346843 [Mycena polygramma]